MVLSSICPCKCFIQLCGRFSLSLHCVFYGVEVFNSNHVKSIQSSVHSCVSPTLSAESCLALPFAFRSGIYCAGIFVRVCRLCQMFVWLLHVDFHGAQHHWLEGLSSPIVVPGLHCQKLLDCIHADLLCWGLRGILGILCI